MNFANDNKAFSLVELIMVFSIMAVLVGVMAPQYVKYLNKTKYTEDCTSISTILDACEVIGLDPNTTWGAGEANQITITINSTATTYSGGASSELNDYVPASSVKLQGTSWGTIVIYAIKANDGSVTFDITDDDQIADIREYSSATADRLE